MLLTRLLNACHHFPGFVYTAVRLIEATSTIEIDVRARRGSRPRCSCCGRCAAGDDVLPVRRFEFIPIWGYAVQLRQCGVKVEQCLKTCRAAPAWQPGRYQGLHPVVERRRPCPTA
jgi:transposase